MCEVLTVFRASGVPCAGTGETHPAIHAQGGRRRGGSDRQHRFSGQRIRAVWLPSDHGPADGWRVNHKRVERIWRREGLKVPARHPKRGRLWLK